MWVVGSRWDKWSVAVAQGSHTSLACPIQLCTAVTRVEFQKSRKQAKGEHEDGRGSWRKPDSLRRISSHLVSGACFTHYGVTCTV